MVLIGRYTQEPHRPAVGGAAAPGRALPRRARRPGDAPALRPGGRPGRTGASHHRPLPHGRDAHAAGRVPVRARARAAGHPVGRARRGRRSASASPADRWCSSTGTASCCCWPPSVAADPPGGRRVPRRSRPASTPRPRVARAAGAADHARRPGDAAASRRASHLRSVVVNDPERGHRGGPGRPASVATRASSWPSSARAARASPPCSRWSVPGWRPTAGTVEHRW